MRCSIWSSVTTGGFDAAPSTRGYERSDRCTDTVLPSSRSTRAIFTVASSCNQNAETIGDARPGNVATFGRDLAQTEISDKTAQVQSESAHLSLDGEALYGSYRVKFDLQEWLAIQTGVKSPKTAYLLATTATPGLLWRCVVIGSG